MRRLVAVITVVSLVSLIGIACAPAQAPPPEIKEKELKIGVQLILTGPLASAFATGSTGVKLYLKYVNDELGGIEYRDPVSGKVDHVRLDLLLEDNAFNPAKAISIYKRQKAAGVKMMIVMGSAACEGVTGFLEHDHMPNIAAFSTMSEILKSPYFMSDRDAPLDVLASIMNWIIDNRTEPGQPTIGLILPNYPSYRLMANPEQLPAFATEKDINLLWEWVTLPPTDVTLELTRLMKEEPDWIILQLVPAAHATVLKDAQRLAVWDKVKWATIAGSATERIVDYAGELSEGFYQQVMTSLPTEDVPGIQLASHIWEKYENRQLEILGVQCIPDAMFICEGIRLALEETGYKDLTSDDLLNGFLSVADLDTKGLTPPLTIDPKWPLMNPYTKMTVIEGGKVKSVSDWYEYPGLTRRIVGDFQR